MLMCSSIQELEERRRQLAEEVDKLRGGVEAPLGQIPPASPQTGASERLQGLAATASPQQPGRSPLAPDASLRGPAGASPRGSPQRARAEEEGQRALGGAPWGVPAQASLPAAQPSEPSATVAPAVPPVAHEGCSSGLSAPGRGRAASLGRRLSHAELLAHAKAVERETADAIARARAASSLRSRSQVHGRGPLPRPPIAFSAAEDDSATRGTAWSLRGRARAHPDLQWRAALNDRPLQPPEPPPVRPRSYAYPPSPEEVPPTPVDYGYAALSPTVSYLTHASTSPSGRRALLRSASPVRDGGCSQSSAARPSGSGHVLEVRRPRPSWSSAAASGGGGASGFAGYADTDSLAAAPCLQTTSISRDRAEVGAVGDGWHPSAGHRSRSFSSLRPPAAWCAAEPAAHLGARHALHG